MKVALRCSTFSSLMDAAAFRNLMKPEWLQRLATIVTIVFLIVTCASMNPLENDSCERLTFCADLLNASCEIFATCPGE